MQVPFVRAALVGLTLASSLVTSAWAQQGTEDAALRNPNPFARPSALRKTAEPVAPQASSPEAIRPAPAKIVRKATPVSSPAPVPLGLPPSLPVNTGLPPAISPASLPPLPPTPAPAASDSAGEQGARVFLSRDEIQMRRSRCPETLVKAQTLTRVPATSEVVTLRLSASASCLMAVSSDSDWIEPASTGADQVDVLVQENDSKSSRRGQVILVTPQGRQTLYIEQAARAPVQAQPATSAASAPQEQ